MRISIDKVGIFSLGVITRTKIDERCHLNIDTCPGFVRRCITTIPSSTRSKAGQSKYPVYIARSSAH